MSKVAYNYEEAQRLLIKSIIAQPDAIPSVSETINSDDFSNIKYKEIYKASLDLYSLSEAITGASLFKYLKYNRNIDLLAEDLELFSNPPTDAPITLAEILKSRSIVNKAIELSNLSAEELATGNTPLETLGKLQKEASELSFELSDDNKKTLKDEVKDLAEHILQDQGEEMYFIPSPYESLNKYINGGFRPEQLITVGARTGIGKALDIKTPILTKDGWKNMGDIQVGDIIYGKDGKETKVIFATDIQYNRECYELYFSNNDSIIADAEHLWEASSYKDRKKRVSNIYNTEYMFNTQRVCKDNRANYSIQKTKPIIFTKNDKDIPLPIDPYILGYWLGDGISRSLRIVGYKDDLYNIESEMKRAGYYYNIKYYGNLFKIKFSLFKDVFEGYRIKNGKDSLLRRFRDLNLIMNKHIPEIYKKSSSSQRIELLKGLMDSGGTASKAGRQEFGVTRRILYEDTLELANSLGITPFINNTKKVNELTEDRCTAYSFSFKSSYPYFKLNRKLNRVIRNNNQREGKLYIKRISKTNSVPVKCIQVDNEDHIYLAGKSLIPTHNTVVATQATATACSEGKSVLYFSLEMSSAELIKRLTACHGNIMLSLLEPRPDRDLSTKQRIEDVMKDIAEWNLKIIDDTDVTIEKIRSSAQQMAQSEIGLDMIIIDYLQLISSKGMRGNSRQEIVAEISRNCKMMAKELNVPVMVLVQLNREQRGDDEDRLPSKADIRESAAIAADSDIILILHRKNRDDSPDPKATFILDKNRGGPSDRKFNLRCVLEKNIFQDLREDSSTNKIADDNNSGEDNTENDFENIVKNSAPATNFGDTSDIVDWPIDDVGDDIEDDYDSLFDMEF